MRAIQYLKTIGIKSNQPVGRGFGYPYDVAFSSDGRIFALNRERVRNPRGTRIQVFTFDEDWRGECGNGKGRGDDQFMQCHGWWKDGFVLEYRDGSNASHFQCSNSELSLADVSDAFQSYLTGGDLWRTVFSWKRIQI